MRSARETTAQTTCDGGDGFCPEYVITAFFDSTTDATRAARHRKAATEAGWVDYEGRDYCPAHIPAGAHLTP